MEPFAYVIWKNADYGTLAYPLFQTGNGVVWHLVQISLKMISTRCADYRLAHQYSNIEPKTKSLLPVSRGGKIKKEEYPGRYQR